MERDKTESTVLSAHAPKPGFGCCLESGRRTFKKPPAHIPADRGEAFARASAHLLALCWPLPSGLGFR
jgi:hypothetical protein